MRLNEYYSSITLKSCGIMYIIYMLYYVIFRNIYVKKLLILDDFANFTESFFTEPLVEVDVLKRSNNITSKKL